MVKLAAASLVTSFCFIASGIGKEPESRGEGNRIEKGTVHFRPAGDQKNIPERYRLEDHSFDFEMELMREMPNSGVAVYHVRFPSPVKTDCPENNTVHAEYYRPLGAESVSDGRVSDGTLFPGVI